MGLKKEAKYVAYLVTKSNGFEKRREVFGLPFHKEHWVRKGSEVLGLPCHR